MKNRNNDVLLTSLESKPNQKDTFAEQTTGLLVEHLDNARPDNRWGKRHWQVLNICFLVFVAYYARNSLSVAIVAMNDRNSTINPDVTTFNWTNKNTILSAFFIGYVPSQILTSWLISQIGVKWFGVSSIGLCSLFGIITPQIAGWVGDKGLIAMRVLQGVTQGFVFPAVQHLMAQWVPANERAGLGGTVYAAKPVATLICMLLSGYMAASWCGWPLIFYVSNGIGLVWCLTFALFSYDNPSDHPTISVRETEYIQKALGRETEIEVTRPVATVTSMLLSGYMAASWCGWPLIFYVSNGIGIIWCLTFAIFSYDNPSDHPTISVKETEYIQKALGSETEKEKKKIPWRSILSSGPFWAVSITQAGFSWGFWTQQTQTPMYMKYVMKFNIENSGSLSALPYLAQWLMCYLFSFTSDYLLNKNYWSINTARKTMNSIGMFIPAIMLILLSNTGPEESTKAVILLVIGIAVNGASFCGFMVNQMDLSPRFASILVGISNGPGQITGLLAPLFVQAVVKNDTDPNEWKYVFYTAAGIYIISGIIFVVFGSGEVQYWDNIEEHKRKQRAARK